MKKISRDVPKHELYAPLIWGLVFAALTIKPLLTGNDLSLALLFVTFSIMGFAIFLNYVFGYVDPVYWDADDIVLLRKGKEIRLPLSEIREIKKGIAKPPTLIIVPKNNSSFDKQVRFQPCVGRFYFGYREDVQALLKKVKKNV